MGLSKRRAGKTGGFLGASDDEFARRVRTQLVFSTGEIGRICQVASRTVSKWCDTSKLSSYRLPAGAVGGRGGEERRVPREELIRFLKASGIRTRFALQEKEVLAAVVSVGLSCALSGLLGGGWEVKPFGSPVRAAAYLGSGDCQCVLMDYGITNSETRDLIQICRASVWRPLVMGVATEDRGQEELLAMGFDDTFVPDVPARAVADVMAFRGLKRLGE